MEVKWPTDMAFDWFGDKIKEGMTDIAVDLITVSPILIGVSIPVYALLGMFSKSLAKLGVIGVFAYGGLVLIIG